MKKSFARHGKAMAPRDTGAALQEAFMPFANGEWGVREHRERPTNTVRTGSM